MSSAGFKILNDNIFTIEVYSLKVVWEIFFFFFGKSLSCSFLCCSDLLAFLVFQHRDEDPGTYFSLLCNE